MVLSEYTTIALYISLNNHISYIIYMLMCIYHMGCFLFNQSWRFLKLASHPNRHGGHINYGPSVETQMPVDIRASTLRQDQPDSWRRKKWGWLMQPSIPKQKKLWLCTLHFKKVVLNFACVHFWRLICRLFFWRIRWIVWPVKNYLHCGHQRRQFEIPDFDGDFDRDFDGKIICNIL